MKVEPASARCKRSNYDVLGQLLDCYDDLILLLLLSDLPGGHFITSLTRPAISSCETAANG